MKSMTGYGYCESGSLDGVDISVEIKTVNRKQLDIKINMPRELQAQELEVRRLILDNVSRGSIYVKINMLLSGSILNQTVKVNDELAAIFISKAEQIKDSLGVSGNLEIKDIFLLPGVIEQSDPDILSDKLTASLLATVKKAVDELNLSRNHEGDFLKKDMEARIAIMEALVYDIEPLASQLPDYYKSKLQKRLEDENLLIISKPNLSDNGETSEQKQTKSIRIDDDRLLRELVIYSDKCDVSEEITRLKSHFIQFKSLLNSDDKAVGRSLDFLTQEIQREINTLGVKAASTEISPKVMLFKTEAEKVREQIQNIE